MSSMCKTNTKIQSS